jgi:starvation-inducible DNA-binding protein
MMQKTAEAPARAQASRSQRDSQKTRLFPTKNDLPAETRARVADLLNQRLADCIDLQTQCKQAHWNVKGPGFIGLHKLFDEINEAVEEYVDLLAERAVQLGGVAEGTARCAAERSSLSEYPLEISNGMEHVDALSTALATFGRATRKSIDEMEELGDADTMDMLTDISRGIDKWLWFVEAHQQDRTGGNGAR